MSLKKTGKPTPAKKTAAKKQSGKETLRSRSAAPVRSKAPARAKAPSKPATAHTGTTGNKRKSGTTAKKCQVTFQLPKIAAPNAKSVCIVGDFNNWNTQATPMEKLKKGHYSISMELEPGREYQYRFLIDKSRWENDWNADKYVWNPSGNCDNSVKIT